MLASELSMPQDWRPRARDQRQGFLRWIKKKLEALAVPGDSFGRQEKLKYIVLCRSEQYEKAHWKRATSKKDYTGRLRKNLKGLEAEVLRALNVHTPAQHDARIKLQEAQHASSAPRASGPSSKGARKAPRAALEDGDVGCARRAAARARDRKRGVRAGMARRQDRLEQRRGHQCMEYLTAVPEGDEPLDSCELGAGVTVDSCHVPMPSYELLVVDAWIDADKYNAPPSPSSPTSCFEEAASAFSQRFQGWVQALVSLSRRLRLGWTQEARAKVGPDPRVA